MDPFFVGGVTTIPCSSAASAPPPPTTTAPPTASVPPPTAAPTATSTGTRSSLMALVWLTTTARWRRRRRKTNGNKSSRWFLSSLSGNGISSTWETARKRMRTGNTTCFGKAGAVGQWFEEHFLVADYLPWLLHVPTTRPIDTDVTNRFWPRSATFAYGTKHTLAYVRATRSCECEQCNGH